jgi:hypothetical protein
MLVLVTDCPVGQSFRRDQKLLKISFLPGMGEARGVDRGAFRAALDSDRLNTRGSLDGPSDHNELIA